MARHFRKNTHANKAKVAVPSTALPCRHLGPTRSAVSVTELNQVTAAVVLPHLLLLFWSLLRAGEVYLQCILATPTASSLR